MVSIEGFKDAVFDWVLANLLYLFDYQANLISTFEGISLRILRSSWHRYLGLKRTPLIAGFVILSLLVKSSVQLFFIVANVQNEVTST